MDRGRLRYNLAALLCLAFLGGGCGIFGGGGDEEAGASSSTGGFDSGRDGGMGASGGFGSEVVTGEKVAELETIYFDFDRSFIRDDQKPTLRSNAGAIRNHGEWRTVVIEGHCDERGSEEYNLALGERRANAAKQYLVDSGVPAARLDTVSFGEAKPAVQGHDESAWRWNRRTEFRVLR
jgi:peptidoglycan-associated lipoprotein